MGRELSDCDTSLTPSGREREERLGGSILAHYVVPWRVLTQNGPDLGSLLHSVMAWAPSRGYHTEDELREVPSSSATQ